MADIRAKSTVVNFLLDTSTYKKFDEVVIKFQLPQDARSKLLDATDFIIRGEKGIQDLPAIIMQDFNVDEEKAKKISSDIAGFRLLPLLPYLPGVDSAIVSWGGEVENFPRTRVVKVEDTPEYKIQKMAEESDLQLPEHLMKRFVDLGAKYLTGERNGASISKLYMRPINIGGLEMTQQEVDGLLKKIDVLKQAAQTAKNTNVQVENFESQPVSVEPIKPADTVPVAKSIAPTLEKHVLPKQIAVKPVKQIVKTEKIEAKEESESQDVKKGIIETPLAMQLPGVENNTAQVSTPKFKQKEKVQIIPAEPVIVADQNKVDDVKKQKDQGEKNTKLNLNNNSSEQSKPKKLVQKIVTKKPEAKKEEKIVEKKPTVQIKKPSSALQKTQKTDLATTVPVISGVILEEQKNSQNQKSENKLTAESSIDDRIKQALQPAREISKKNGFKKSDFDALTDKHLRGVRDPIRTESLLRDKLKLEGEDLQKMMMSLEQARRISQGYDGNAKDNKAFESNQVLPSVEKQKEILNAKHQAMTGTTAQPIAPIAPSAQVSAARTKQHELQIQESKINKEALGVAQQKSAPPRAKVELSAQSSPPVQGDSVKMTDVKFARKLSGPVEELGAMNTTEFRRLSSDPMAAAQKILDKIDLLEDSSYEDRISGVKAWRRNPVNGLYLSMMREALEKGIAVAEVATIRRNTGDESLSPAEIKALMFLNEKIKF